MESKSMLALETPKSKLSTYALTPLALFYVISPSCVSAHRQPPPPSSDTSLSHRQALSRSRAAAVPPGWPAGLGGAPPGMEELLRRMNGQQRMGGAGFGAGMDGDGDETG